MEASKHEFMKAVSGHERCMYILYIVCTTDFCANRETHDMTSHLIANAVIVSFEALPVHTKFSQITNFVKTSTRKQKDITFKITYSLTEQ